MAADTAQVVMRRDGLWVWRQGWLWLLVLVCAGCTTAPTRLAGKTDAQQPAELKQWQASGKLGISGAEQSGSGSFNWQQVDSLSRLLVRGPVGTGALQITLDDAQLTMQAGDGSQYDAAQVMSELEARLGAAVPVRQLRYWLLGLPGAGEYQWLDTAHRELLQDGWRVTYSEPQQQGALRLPGRVVLTREALRIVVVVQRWQLN